MIDEYHPFNPGVCTFAPHYSQTSSQARTLLCSQNTRDFESDSGLRPCRAAQNQTFILG
jgi:hypothetical protein